VGIKILGFIFSVLCFLGVFFNYLSSNPKTFNGPTVSLFFAGFFGLLICLVPVEKFSFMGVDVALKKAKKYANEAREAKNVALEALAINIWNAGRIPGEDSIKASQNSAKSILKKIYGSDYKERVKRLIDDQILRVPDSALEFLEIQKTTRPSSELPFYKNPRLGK